MPITPEEKAKLSAAHILRNAEAKSAAIVTVAHAHAAKIIDQAKSDASGITSRTLTRTR